LEYCKEIRIDKPVGLTNSWLNKDFIFSLAPKREQLQFSGFRPQTAIKVEFYFIVL
jgi:hypothetical protein